MAFLAIIANSHHPITYLKYKFNGVPFKMHNHSTTKVLVAAFVYCRFFLMIVFMITNYL